MRVLSITCVHCLIFLVLSLLSESCFRLSQSKMRLPFPWMLTRVLWNKDFTAGRCMEINIFETSVSDTDKLILFFNCDHWGVKVHCIGINAYMIIIIDGAQPFWLQCTISLKGCFKRCIAHDGNFLIWKFWKMMTNWIYCWKINQRLQKLKVMPKSL